MRKKRAFAAAEWRIIKKKNLFGARALPSAANEKPQWEWRTKRKNCYFWFYCFSFFLQRIVRIKLRENPNEKPRLTYKLKELSRGRWMLRAVSTKELICGRRWMGEFLSKFNLEGKIHKRWRRQSRLERRHAWVNLIMIHDCQPWRQISGCAMRSLVGIAEQMIY